MVVCRHTLWVLLALSLGLSASAHAEELRLKPGFTPHPYNSKLIEQRVDRVYLGDLGYGKCGNSFTTKAPWFTFHVDEPLTDVNIVFQNPGGDNLSNAVVVFPNGGYACARRGNVHAKDWPKGEYKIWFFTPAQSVRAHVRIEQPDRLKAEVLDALASAPQIRFSDKPKVNPQWISAPPTPSAHARVIETQCAKGTQSLHPLARLKVVKKGRFMLRASAGGILVESEGGCVTDEATRQNNTLYNNEYILNAGEYKVWARGDANGPVVIQADDLSQPLAFGDPREVKELGALDKPMLISAKTQKPQRWPARRNACRSNQEASRAPDFYVRSKDALSGVRLSLYRNDNQQSLRIYGPLETAAPYSRMVCDVDKMRFLNLEGTYAVWVTGSAANVGKEYHLLALREAAEVDPMQTLLDIPDTLTLNQRAIGNHYPFFGSMSYGYLFPRAPERLFVYAVRPLKAGDQIVAKGEPLVIVGVNKNTFNLRRYDGTRLSAKRADLTDARPSKVVLPTKPSFKPAKTYDDSWSLVTPADAKRVARVRAVEGKYRSCVGTWMSKNDPTWGKSYDLVYLSGPAVGKTLSDLKFDEAAGVCGESNLIKAQKNFVRQVNAAAKLRATTHLRAVTKRFKR